MIDAELKANIHEKIESGDFAPADIPAYLKLFCQIGEATDDVQDEVAGWDRKIQFQLQEGDNVWITVEGGKFAEGAGALENPDLVLTLSPQNAALMFAGQKDAKVAYQTGALKITGKIPDALKLQTILGIVNEEIEY